MSGNSKTMMLQLNYEGEKHSDGAPGSFAIAM